MEGATKNQDGADAGFPLFAFFWAAATLIHQLAFTFWASSWQGWVLVVFASAVIVVPGCGLRFLGLVIASLLNWLHKMPFVPNHILFEAFLHIGLLFGAATAFTKREVRAAVASSLRQVGRGSWILLLTGVIGKIGYLALFHSLGEGLWGAVTTLLMLGAIINFLSRLPASGVGGAWFPGAAPFLRWAVLIVYWWAVLQKLNVGYWDPEVSCAYVLHKEIAVYFGGLVPTAPWTAWCAIIGSLLLELSIPVLLMVRRTRWFGVFVAFAFHLWLAIHPAAGIYSFTALVIAVLPAFFAQDERERIAQWLLVDHSRHKRRAWTMVALFLAALTLQGFFYIKSGRNYETFGMANRVGFWCCVSLGVWAVARYVPFGRRLSFASSAYRFTLPAPLYVLPLAIIFINGCWTWVGGKTQTSFSMYSNLRSEGESNHWFLKRIDLFPYQTDLVTVLDSSPSILDPDNRPGSIEQFANPSHNILPAFELQRLVSRMTGEFMVRYERGGEVLTIGHRNGADFGDAELHQEHPWLQKKFLWFRRLKSIEGKMVCTH